MNAVEILFPSAWIVISISWGLFLLMLSRLAVNLNQIIKNLLDVKNLQGILTLFYDPICPICSREIKYLKKRKKTGNVNFYALESKLEFEKRMPEIDYLSAMKEIHAIKPNGKVIKGTEAFSQLYARTDHAFLAIMLKSPLFKNFFSYIYPIFAKYRLKHRCKIQSLKDKR